VRYLILSDIHANWEALDAVIHDAAGRYDQSICCGDLIGYGADPNPAVDWVRANCCITVRGNHDKASTGLDDLEWFNPVARNAALWTQRTLAPENAEWVRNLPTGPIDLEDFQILHGSPIDEDEYVIAATEAGQAFTYLQRRIAFFGHTHVQGGFSQKEHDWHELRPRYNTRDQAESWTLTLPPGTRHLINPGSVGQPRDCDWRAAFAIYDTEASAITFHRIPYDVTAAQGRILLAGLPERLASRLREGR
jgi:predicted phosphodiesterase